MKNLIISILTYPLTNKLQVVVARKRSTSVYTIDWDNPRIYKLVDEIALINKGLQLRFIKERLQRNIGKHDTS